MKLLFLSFLLIPSMTFAGAWLTVDGSATTKPTHWTVDELKHMPTVPTTQISFQSHDGSAHHWTCVALIDLLETAGIATEIKMDPKADPRTKHRSLRMIVTARATDGYAVVFSLSELLADIGHRRVWVALDQDGAPLSDRDSPVKLIVPTDAKPARWVHGVEEFSVDDLTPSR